MEKKINKNASLRKANSVKNDEFYTQLTDIEKEMVNYREHFKGKTILCNCDDPRVSNFFKYFALNFNFFGLKKLISTCYKSQNFDLFSQYDSEKAVYAEYTGSEKDHIPTDDELELKYFEGDGDFRNQECIEILKQADIVVTNPPFSLFREFVSQLIEYDKKFIIVGNKNAVTYKEIFSLIKDNKMRIGYRSMNTDFWLEVPEGAAYEKEDEGKHLKHIMACWYTNFPTKKMNEEMILFRQYNPVDYPKYDNYDAINVDKVTDIPCDYGELMGVPLTFVDKYNPNQFEIVGLWADKRDDNPIFIKGESVYLDDSHKNFVGPVLNGKATYARIIIRRRK